jgi:site-specific DNA-adenine methylase
MASYPGGKAGDGVYQKIINLMPPHRIYIEPFLGGGAIMRLKRPAACSIGIDADGDVFESWRCVITPQNLTILHGDAFAWLEDQMSYLMDHHFTPDTLIYCDPPYLLSTRRQHRLIYRYELSDADHVRLLSILRGLPCMVMISGYWSELYSKTLHDWRSVSFQARTRGGSTAIEWVWMNFPEPMELHDYSFLGDDFRQRERIKRKTARWRRRLSEMPVLERHAMMNAIVQLRG